jgi:hypothetical protein
MIDTFVKLKNESLKYNLIVNVHKTKYLKCSMRQDQLKPTSIENKVEQVKSFTYLGSTVYTDNTIEEETKERIAARNKAFFTIKKIFQSKLISKMAKLKLYFSTVRPIVTYACETWTLKETITHRLMVFERKILRKLFGPTYGLAILKECQEQEWSRQYTPGNPFQTGQQEDQRQAGRMILSHTKNNISYVGKQLHMRCHKYGPHGKLCSEL